MLHGKFAIHLNTVISSSLTSFQAREHGGAGGDGAEVPCECRWKQGRTEVCEFACIEDAVAGGELEDDSGVDGEDVEAFVVGVDDGGVV